MKISNTTPGYINQSYTAQKGSAAAKQPKPAETTAGKADSFSDNISLSERTRELQKISTAADTDAAQRQKYVAELKQKVESNEYKIDIDAVAQKMAGTLMDDIV